MAADGTGSWRRFQALVFSDYERFREGGPSWPQVLGRCLSVPGLLASLVLRAQQTLHEAGRTGLAGRLRTLGVALTGLDAVPGVQVGPGVKLEHPVGVVLGAGATVGRDVTFAGGVTLGVRDPHGGGAQGYPTIGDGAVLGANAVLLGRVHVGPGAIVAANAVVLDDVPAGAVVVGAPARPVGPASAAPDEASSA